MSLVVIVDDPDAPGATWDHWVAYDISPTESIPENVDPIGTAGLSSWNVTAGYEGPCPPNPGRTRRYFFTVLALDDELGLPEGATKEALLAAAESHVLAEAVLMGTYVRWSSSD